MITRRTVASAGVVAAIAAGFGTFPADAHTSKKDLTNSRNVKEARSVKETKDWAHSVKTSSLVCESGDLPPLPIELGGQLSHLRTTDSNVTYADPGRGNIVHLSKHDIGYGLTYVAQSQGGGTSTLRIGFGRPVESLIQISSDLSYAVLDNGKSIALHSLTARTESGSAAAVKATLSGGAVALELEAAEGETAIAAASFDYSFQYGIAGTDPADANATLHRCFNCKFPLTGAPEHFPSIGELLPLTVLGFNFHCTFREVYDDRDGDGSQWWAFTFDSAPGHIDGPGSWINFAFVSLANGQNQLMVAAHVAAFPLDGPFGSSEAGYKLGAKAQWSTFASKMITVP